MKFMGREITGQEIKEKLKLKLFAPVVAIVFGLASLSLAVGLFVIGPKSESQPLAPLEALEPNTYALAQVIFKVKPGKDVNAILDRALNVKQEVFQNIKTGKIVEKLSSEVVNQPQAFKLVKMQLHKKYVRPLFPQVTITAEVQQKILQRPGAKDPVETYFELGLDRWYIAEVEEKQADVAQLIQRFKSDKTNIEVVEPNGITKHFATQELSDDIAQSSGSPGTTTSCSNPNDPYSCSRGHLPQPELLDQWSIEASNLRLAWETTKGSPHTIIAVPDSGVDYRHTDIAEKIWLNTSEDINDNGCADYWSDLDYSEHVNCQGQSVFTSGDLDGRDNDNNGYIDDVNGMDLVHDSETINDTEAYTTNDGDGPADPIGGNHGSFIAGIIGATTNNGIGMAGVCPECTIMPIRNSFGGIGWASDAQRAASIIYAVNNGADIINMSWGANNVISPTFQYATNVGVVLVAAAGNRDVWTGQRRPIVFPADYPDVIAVGAIAADLQVPTWVSYGPSMSIVAPGENLLSIRARDIVTRDPATISDPARIINDDYQLGSGTSYSAPIVSGIIGLIKSANPYLSSTDIKEILESTATDITSSIDENGILQNGLTGWDQYSGYGRVNAAAALERARNELPDLLLLSASPTIRGQDMVIRGVVSNTSWIDFENVNYTATLSSGTAIAHGIIPVVTKGTITEFEMIASTVPATGTAVTVLIDSNGAVPERNEDNNRLTRTVVVNRAPALSVNPTSATIAEGQLFTAILSGTDPDFDWLDYQYQMTTTTGVPVSISGSLSDTYPGKTFIWRPDYDQSGQYQLSFTVSDGIYSISRVVNLTVTDAVTPTSQTLFQYLETDTFPDGRAYIGPYSWDKKLSGPCSDEGSSRCHLRESQRLILHNIPVADIAYIRFMVDTHGKWDAAPLAGTKVSDSVKVYPLGNGKYEFDAFPSLGSETDINGYTSGYMATLRFVEQDDQGRNFGTSMFGGWSRNWPEWMYECTRGASSGSFDKNGVGFRVWTYNGHLYDASLCFIDDSNGDLSVSWEASVRRKSQNLPPQFVTGLTVGEHETLSVLLAPDPNGDRLKFSNPQGVPNGASLDVATGRLTWTPSDLQSGNYAITVTASDGFAPPVTATIPITVQERNERPRWTTPPPSCRATTVPKVLSFSMTASDPNGQPVTYSAGTGPAGTGPLPAGAGMSVTGNFSWNMLSGTPSTTIVFSARDPFGAATQQTTFIVVNGSCGGSGGGSGPTEETPPVKRTLPEL